MKRAFHVISFLILLFFSSYIPVSAEEVSQSLQSTWGVYTDSVDPLLSPTNTNISTNYAYTYLAGQLILSGYVNASGCANGGILGNDSANICGMNLARSQVASFQNQFDPAIIRSAQRYNLPPKLLKNLFGVESQMWPGKYPLSVEGGLGHMTDAGADMTLQWSPEVFWKFCNDAYSNSFCSTNNYNSLGLEEKQTLVGLVLASVDATCAECSHGIDVPGAFNSVETFALALMGAGRQVDHILRSYTNNTNPGNILSVDDLWKITLFTYNGGSGCLNTSLAQMQSGTILTYDMIAGAASTLECKRAVSYVEKVSTHSAQNIWGDQTSYCQTIWAVPSVSKSMTDDVSATWTDTYNPVLDMHPKLTTTYRLNILAGKLIESGYVDTSQCNNRGLIEPGVADGCGMDAASTVVIQWQNIFDDTINKYSEMYLVPPFLLKSMFSVESQFWPGQFPHLQEVGLGHATAFGVDGWLLWNPDLYKSTCYSVFPRDYCNSVGYGNLNYENKGILRGKIIEDINATCPTCAGGVDLNKAAASIGLFAQGINSVCVQTDRLIRKYNNGTDPGVLFQYGDLWNLTLFAYNGGSGCLENAVASLYYRHGPYTWNNVLNTPLEQHCKNAVNYVNAVMNKTP